MIDPDTGILTMAAQDYEAPGDADRDRKYEVTVRVTDGESNSAATSISVTVTGVNEPPETVGTLAGQDLQVGDGDESVDVSGGFRDVDGDTLTYGASSSAPGVARARASGSRVTLTPVTISHQVSGADYGSVRAAAVRVTIVETDRSTLSVEAAEGSESGGTLVFHVTLSRSSTSDVTVDYATTDGSGSAGARAGSDYTASSGTLTFTAGSRATQQIVVDIMHDTEDEEEEEIFGLALRNAQHASLAGGGSTLRVTGTIRDDDDPEVEVSFGSVNYDVTEGGTVTVVVRLNRDPERNLDIDLVRTHHGGASEADYSGVPERVTFSSGVTTRTFEFGAAEDGEDDDGESVAIGFGDLPSRVDGGAETTVSIQDDDDPEVVVSFGSSSYEVPCGSTAPRRRTSGTGSG